ncbi:hypothetical protein VTJ83DRAFT_299 [Remersonia thermophila]|uniref:Uncharacterized protein n=1 Tax=Remersonia thermophila TaxID=72144 RepID=A0ABR4DKL1_9PEZI
MTDTKHRIKDDHLVSASLLEKIDKLREKNVGQHIPLPQLVVVGDQSSGKSSLLESLTGIPFPRDVELCTRYATQITQQRDEVSSVTVSITAGPFATDKHKAWVEGYQTDPLSPEDFRARFPKILREVNSRMGIRMGGEPESGYSSDEGEGFFGLLAKDGTGNRVFSDDVLKIEIRGPSVDYLTVIDVPGIFRTPTEGITTMDDMSLVRDMVTRYIKDKRTIILAVLPCNIDISNQEILTLAANYDPSGERTLGILTKPDLVTEPSGQAAVCNIVLGKRKQLTLGYYVVRSRGADQDDKDFARREEMFNKAPWNTLPRERVGVRALKERLAELLSDITGSAFPEIRNEIDEQLRQARRQLEQLGPSRQDDHEQRKYLSGIAGRFQAMVRQALEAQYSGNDAFGKNKLRLVTQVVSLAHVFDENFRENGLARRFELDPDAQTEHALPKQANMVAEKMQCMNLEKEVEDLKDIVCSGYSASGPQDGIMEWLKELHLGYRGMNLGSSSSSVWESAWTEQSCKWPDMSREFVSRVVLAIHGFIREALDHVCADRRVRNQLWSTVRSELLERYRAAMRAAEQLVAAEREGKPYTLDHRFNESRQRARGERMARRLKELGGHDARIDIKPAAFSIAQVRNVTVNKSNLDDVVEALHDDLHAYYDIARKRFVDSLVTQVVNYHLLFGPPEVTPLGVFSQDWVIGLKPHQLEAIAGEKPSTRDTRQALGRKIADLTAAREIVQ